MNVVEGAFRKWSPFFEAGTWKYAMYFSKDIVFGCILLIPARSLRSPAVSLFTTWFIVGGLLFGAGALISSLNGLNPVGALLTARACLLLPLLVLLAVPRLAGLRLHWIGWVLVGLTFLNFGLGLQQNRLPVDHILNRYADAGMQVVATQTGVRAAGTFAYITGMALLSTVGVWTGMVLLGLKGGRWQHTAGWAAILAGFGCGLVSISRAPLVIGALMFGVWMLSSRTGLSVVTRSLAAGVGLVGLLVMLQFTGTFAQLGRGVMQRQELGADTFEERAFGQFGQTMKALASHPFGNGFGTEQVAGNYYTTGVMQFTTYEEPLPRLVMETGFLGLIGYLVICAGAILSLQTAKRHAAGNETKSVLLATQLLLISMFYGSVLFNHTASAFAWLIFAAVMAAVVHQTPLVQPDPIRKDRRHARPRRWGKSPGTTATQNNDETGANSAQT